MALRNVTFLGWSLLVGLALPGKAIAAGPDRPGHVLLVSIDGLAWDRLQKYLPRLPTLAGLAAAGSAGPLQTVFPSMTWAAHASLATGMNPGGHGVLGNRYYDRASDDIVESWQRDASLLRAPALWQVAKAAGWSTAALLWPQTNRATGLDFQIPEVYGQRNFETGSSSDALAALQAHAGLPSGHLGRLGGEEMFLLDSWQRDAAVWLVTARQPKLLALHFLSLDTLSHSWGPAAIEPRWGLELIDRYLADVLHAYQGAGLRDKLVVCVVSDHGFLELSQAFSPAEALRQSPLSAGERGQIRIAVNGHALFIYAKGPQPPPLPVGPVKKGSKPPKLSPVQTALVKFKAHLVKQSEVEAIIEPEQFGELGLGDPVADPNLPEFIAILRPDVQSIQGHRPAPRGKLTAGGHGYLPSHPALQGAWLLAGPGVAKAKLLAGSRAIDVAPTLAKLLGWTWPQPQHGTPKAEALVQK